MGHAKFKFETLGANPHSYKFHWSVIWLSTCQLRLISRDWYEKGLFSVDLQAKWEYPYPLRQEKKKKKIMSN